MHACCRSPTKKNVEAHSRTILMEGQKLKEKNPKLELSPLQPPRTVRAPCLRSLLQPLEKISPGPSNFEWSVGVSAAEADLVGLAWPWQASDMKFLTKLKSKRSALYQMGMQHLRFLSFLSKSRGPTSLYRHMRLLAACVPFSEDRRGIPEYSYENSM